MKQIIITAAVFFVICLSNLKAQNSLTAPASIASNFESEFSGASKIQWTKADKVFVAKFTYRDNLWVAYFTEDGEKLASGRKIKSLELLPLQVQQGIQKAKSNQERKFGPIDTSYAFEMVEQGTTKYYVPMANAHVTLMVSADNSGSTTINKKELKHAPAKRDKDMIAKKN